MLEREMGIAVVTVYREPGDSKIPAKSAASDSSAVADARLFPSFQETARAAPDHGSIRQAALHPRRMGLQRGGNRFG
jgi:hypothetical protein